MPNLEKIAAALGLAQTGAKQKLASRIEAKLRNVGFPGNTEFKPTAADLLLDVIATMMQPSTKSCWTPHTVWCSCAASSQTCTNSAALAISPP